MSSTKLPPAEHELIQAARLLLCADHAGLTSSLVQPLWKPPSRLGPRTLALLQQTFAHGAISQLLYRGGWKIDLSLNDQGTPLRGRLWERHEKLPPLRFGPFSYDLCCFIAQPSGENSNSPEPKPKNPLSGDEILCYLACEMIRDQQLVEFHPSLVPYLRKSVLAWLGFPQILCTAGPFDLNEDDLEGFLEREGSLILEALGGDLARQCYILEQGKSNITKTSHLAQLGAAQEKLLETFLSVIEQSQRHDLATFIVDAADLLIQRHQKSAELAHSLRARLEPTDTLAHRNRALKLSGSFFRAIECVGQWYENFRYVRMFDDDYPAAQALLNRWEKLGTHGFNTIRAARRELESIDGTVSESNLPVNRKG